MKHEMLPSTAEPGPHPGANLGHVLGTWKVTSPGGKEPELVGAIRDRKIPRTKPQIVQKRQLKHFGERALIHESFLTCTRTHCLLLIRDQVTGAAVSAETPRLPSPQRV
ncbi:hypothetical protein CRENBAI_003968, partial [Crenichthys baileyi]